MAFGDSFAQSFLSSQAQQMSQALAIADQHWKEEQAKRQDTSLTEQTDYHNKMIDRYDKDRERQYAKEEDYANKALATEKQQRFKDAGQRHKDALAQGLDEDTALAIAGYDPEVEQRIRTAGSRGGNQSNMQADLQQSPAHYLPPEQSQGPQIEQQGLPTGGLGDLLGLLGGVMGAGGGLPSMTTGPGAMAGPRMMEPAGGTAQPFDFGSAQSPAYLEAQRVKEEGIKAQAIRANAAQTTAAVRQDSEARRQWIDDIRAPGLKAQANMLQTKLEQLPEQFETSQELKQATMAHLKALDARSQITDQNNLRKWNATNGRLERQNLSAVDKTYTQLQEKIASANNLVAKDDRDIAKIKAMPNYAADPGLQGQVDGINLARQTHVDNVNALKIEADANDTVRKQMKKNLITIGVLQADGSPAYERMPETNTPQFTAPKAGGLPALPGTGYTPSAPAPTGRNAPTPGGTPDRRTPAQRIIDKYTFKAK